MDAHAHIDLQNQVAVVTGGGRGLGRAHALMLAAKGAAVVVNDVGAPGPRGGDADAEVAAQVTDEIAALGGRALASSHDISTSAGGSALVSAAVEAFGRVDILIHNAGVGGGGAFEELSDELFDAVLGVHLMGAVHVGRPAWKAMKNQHYGRVVLTSSSAVLGLPGKAPYCMAKAGLLGLARALKHEAEALGPTYDIKANVVSPLAATRLGGADLESVFGSEQLAPELVSAVALFLSSPRCRLNGEFLHAGAGHVARMFVGLTRGWAGRRPTLEAEEVEANLNEIMDLGDFHVPDSVQDTVLAMACEVLQDREEASVRVGRWLGRMAAQTRPVET
ncbi:MAG: short-chain dehydrogenase/reductase [Pseudonocardiales bacterium]|nr:short-chain dehydrogenase/reductase [Pseudonocardiales bacterium]